MENQPGEQFGRYELVSQLGRGGMAETWRARLMGAAGVTKPVLIKKILPEYSRDRDFTAMFISEARITATLSHGNVAQVFDFGEVDGEYFLAMEFVDGQPLNRLMKRARKTGLPALPVVLATYTAIEMCRGLHYAHTRTDEAGEPLVIVHRDVSPDNVLISYEGQVKIVDFGIAKARALRDFKTQAGVVRGKYLFFSPEQARAEEVDARTDVWATGVVLYEMLCGRLPLEGPPHVVMSRLVEGDFPAPRELRPDLPAELEDILMRALTVDPDARMQSCHELGNALAGFLFATAPRFSALSLSYFVKELYRQDLASHGREVRVPPAFLEELSMWREAARTSKGAWASQLARPAREEAPTEEAPRVGLTAEDVARLKRRLLAAGGVVAALAIGAVAIATIPEEPPEYVTPEVSQPAPLPVARQEPSAAPPAQPVARPAPSAEEKAPSAPAPLAAAPVPPRPVEESRAAALRPGSAKYPVDAIRLEAARDVVRPTSSSATSPELDPRATYRLSEQRPPANSPPLFYRLSGDAPMADSVGMLSGQAVTVRGARKVTLFTLGASPDGPRTRNVRLVRVGAASPPPIRVNPTMSAASLEKAFTLEGLSGSSVYELKLAPDSEGALLRGSGSGEVRKVVCARRTDPAALAGRNSGSLQREQQFLLQPGRAVRLTAARAVSCGFVDDDPSDNQGGLEIRISEVTRR